MNSVYLGASLDGFIADRNGGLDWLDAVPNPDGDDMGYYAFMDRIDALVMGRVTFETVLGFGVDWPYKKTVYVLSNSRRDVPEDLIGKVEILHGTPLEVVAQIHERGHKRLYIDGGKTMQGFLRAGLVDELIITTIPVILGGGVPLFGKLSKPVELELVSSRVMLDQLVQRHYRVKGQG